MDNKTILNNRWNYTDLKLKDYLRIYKKTNLKTQDNIQDIFNGIDFNYSLAANSDKIETVYKFVYNPTDKKWMNTEIH